MNFSIDAAYLESVQVSEVHNVYAGKENLTEDEFVKALKGEGIMISRWSIDHPEFTKLREYLGTEGYIDIQRRWLNGDSVTKPFTLNGKKFKKNDRFVCACAMLSHLKYM